MSLQDITFLVIEDHPFQLKTLRQMLIGMGAETVHAAENGVEALRLLRDPAMRVDVVITDLAMPEMDGIELLAHLHAARADVSLILASASESNLDAAADIARDHGIQLLGAVGKPITTEDIAALAAAFRARSR